MPVTTTTDHETHQMGDGEVVSARRARQGLKGRPVLYVLLISLALVVIAFGFAFLTTNDQQAAETGGFTRTDDPAAAAQFSTPEPAPKVAPST